MKQPLTDRDTSLNHQVVEGVTQMPEIKHLTADPLYPQKMRQKNNEIGWSAK